MKTLCALLLALTSQSAGTTTSQIQLPLAGGQASRPSQPQALLQSSGGRIPLTEATTPGDANSVFRISQPGSYYLAAQLNGSPGKGGIEIAATNVDIDLRGFTLAGGLGSLDGISASGSGQKNIRVHNGICMAWGGTGIDLLSVEGAQVHQVRSSSNGGFGIRLGAAAVAFNNSSTYNGGTGITLGESSSAENCVAYKNLNGGMTVGKGAVISNCSSTFNENNGLYTNHGVTVTGTTISNNGGWGVYSGDSSHISGCSINDNGLDGIQGKTHPQTVVDCTVNGNGGNGILLTKGGVVRNCVASRNTKSGIKLWAGGIISGCMTKENEKAGIEVTNDVMIRDNVSNGNDTYGYYLTGTRNTLIKNNASSNTSNFHIGGVKHGNLIGPLVGMSGIMPATVHPLSNFSF